MMLGPAAPRCSRSSASCAATSRAPAGRSTRRPARCAGSQLPAGPARESDRLPEPDLHAGLEGARRASTTRTSRSTARDGADRRTSARPRSGRRRSRCTPAAPWSASGPGSSSPTPSSSSACCPSGELILIDEVMTPDSSRFWDAAAYEPGTGPGQLRQAVRPRLARGAAVGQDGAGARAPGRRGRRHPRPLRRGIRAHHRGELRPLPLGGRHRPMSEPARAYRFAVNVTPKPGILDPQGKAVERSLPHLGIAGRQRRPRRPPRRADGRRRRRGRGPRDRRPAGRRAAVEPADGAVRGRGAGRDRGARPSRGWADDASASASSCSRAPTATSTRSTPCTVAGAEPEILWHESADLAGVAGILLPGGLRVRRLPAGRRHRAVQPRHARGRGLRGARRPGPRDLQRLPGPRRGAARARAPCCATAACASCAGR